MSHPVFFVPLSGGGGVTPHSEIIVRDVGLPTVRGKKFSYQKSAVRGKQKSALRGIFAVLSQRGNNISAVHGKS